MKGTLYQKILFLNPPLIKKKQKKTTQIPMNRLIFFISKVYAVYSPFL